MYDSIKLRIYAEDTKCIEQYLHGVSEYLNHGTNRRHFTGYYNNLRIDVIQDYRIDIRGSIAKCHLGTNLETLSRSDLQYAIKVLSKALNFDLSMAKVIRFEFGTNFFMNHHVNEYLDLLWDCSSYFKCPPIGLINSRTLYFKNMMRVLAFYNKKGEMIAHDRDKLPQSYFDKNILRYEVRFNRPSKDFDNKNITVSTLYNEQFFKSTVLFWEKQYFRIMKKGKLIIPEDIQFQTKSAFEQYCVSYAMQNDELRNAVQKSVDNYTIKPYNKSRIKTCIKVAQTNKKLLIDSNRIIELDEMIRDIARRYQ